MTLWSVRWWEYEAEFSIKEFCAWFLEIISTELKKILLNNLKKPTKTN